MTKNVNLLIVEPDFTTKSDTRYIPTYNTFESCPKKNIGFNYSHFIIRIIMESTKFCLGRKPETCLR